MPRVPALAARVLAWPGLIVAGFALLLVVPSANFTWFAGLPLGTPAAVAALAILAPYAFSARLRSAYAAALVKAGKLVPVLVAAAIFGALAFKVLLLLSGVHAGLAACYASLDVPGPPGCERSFANPLYRFQATRLDGALDFGARKVPADFTNLTGLDGLHNRSIQGTNWDLGFLNTLRFNFLPGGPLDPVRRWWPRFDVHWSGTIDVPRGSSLQVRYAGEGVVAIDGSTQPLVASYSNAAVAMLAPGPGRHAITLDYRWDLPGLPSVTAGMPLPELRLLSGGTPVTPAPPGTGWRLLGLGGDLVAGAVGLSLLVVLASQVRRTAVIVGLLAVAGSAAALVVTRGTPTATQGVFLILAAALLVVLLVEARRLSALEFGLTAYLSLVALETAHAIASYGTLNMVLYRGAGQDFLTYEGFARSILETGGLRAGENVFVYSPGIRYLLYALHVLLGDGNVTIGIAGVVALTLCAFLIAHRLQARTADNRASAWRLVLVISLAAVLLLEAVGVDAVRTGFSEYPAWILILLSLYCVLGAPSLRSTVAGVVLAALAFTIRFDEAIGLAMLCGSFALVWATQARQHHVSRARVVGTVAGLGVAAIAITALPALHNLWYGHEFAFLLRSPPSNFPIPFTKALTAVSDTQLRAALLSQIRGIVDLAPDTSPQVLTAAGPVFDVAVRVVQVAWLVAMVWGVRKWGRLSLAAKLLLVAPLAFLIPKVFLQVYVDSPRHIVAGYLVMAVGAALVLAELSGSREDASADAAESSPP